MRVGDNSSLEFDINPVNVDGDFNIVVRYEPTVILIIITRMKMK